MITRQKHISNATKSIEESYIKWRKKLVNALRKELLLKATYLFFYRNVFLKSTECFLNFFLINTGEEKKSNPKSDKYYIIKKKIIMMIMIMIVISNNKNNRLTFGSSRFTRIPEAGLMFVTGFWLPVEEVLIYSHKEKSPAPWGPCGPIGPWEPLNPWGPIAPWDPLNPWGPAGPTVPWEPFTPGGPTGPWRLLTFSTWKENKCSGHGSWKAD